MLLPDSLWQGGLPDISRTGLHTDHFRPQYEHPCHSQYRQGSEKVSKKWLEGSEFSIMGACGEP